MNTGVTEGKAEPQNLFFRKKTTAEPQSIEVQVAASGQSP
jgi:hypothetical protein